MICQRIPLPLGTDWGHTSDGVPNEHPTEGRSAVSCARPLLSPQRICHDSYYPPRISEGERLLLNLPIYLPNLTLQLDLTAN